jgi:hypothetical protein
LLVGAAEVDITPPVGTHLCGSLRPRTADGVDDPLLVKALVLESGGIRVGYGVFDLAVLWRDIGDLCIAEAVQRTGIPEDCVLWSTTQTHSGPYTTDMFEETMGAKVDHAWLAGLPARFAEAMAQADAAKRPARMSRLRGYEFTTVHNRRVRFKGGRQVNTWLLHGGEEDLQCVGAAGPIDPELGMLAFEDEAGALLAVLYHFTLHVNTHFGTHVSADFPAVVAARLREAFGPQVITLHAPGCSGDINRPGRLTYREVGDRLADVMVPLLRGRKPLDSAGPIGMVKREITVPCRDLSVDQEERIAGSQWSPAAQEFFRRELAVMRREGITETKAPLVAWRIGDVAFAHIPGEAFVEWGLQLKEQSPFPWTYPVELSSDYLGYLVTRRAWHEGGYESLLSRVGFVDVTGTETMIASLLDMLRSLRSS